MPHAILFTGPRGTGKTSSARILAKSLCCSKAQDFVPCHGCPDCLDITQGRHVDVIEIDGASNNGVDAIRELRETVGYMPSSGKYKVYIIDEVHMLSTSAFNALLKTLEEPPAHVVFIMATTEAHKIPQTILSRCQRFDFRRIATRKITEHLKKICETEGLPYEMEALWLIARQGDGSMRDSQSLLEQVITFTNRDIKYQKVVETLGLTDRHLVLDTLHAILERNPQKVLSILERFHQTAAEPHLFAQELMEVLRHLTIVKVAGPASQLIVDLQDSEVETLSQWAESLSEEDLHLLFDLALKGVQDILKAFDARLVLEMVLLRLASAPKIESLAKILHSLKTMGNIPTAPTVASAPLATIATTSQNSVLTQGGGNSDRSISLNSPLKNLSGQKVDTNLSINDQWLNFVGLVKKVDGLFGAKLESILFMGLNDKKITLGILDKMQFLKQQLTAPQTAKRLQSYVDQFWGQGYAFDIQTVKDKSAGFSAQALTEQKEQQQKDQLDQQIQSHPLVKTAQAIFKSQIKSVKELP
jgi:DNA polymerase-3 subunit gamma/tau